MSSVHAAESPDWAKFNLLVYQSFGLACIAKWFELESAAHRVNVPFSTAIWPALGSMFMFPNICFLFFPVLDSRAYAPSWFAAGDIACWRFTIRV